MMSMMIVHEIYISGTVVDVIVLLLLMMMMMVHDGAGYGW